MNNSDYEYFQSNYKYDYQFELDLMKRTHREILYDLHLHTRYIKGKEPKLKDLYRQHVAEKYED